MSQDPLSEHLIPHLPQSCYYIPNFISPEEESQILSSIKSLPATKWTNLTHRRLLSLPSPLTGSSRNILLDQPLPNFLYGPIIPRFHELGIFEESLHKTPNHVLVNEYLPGQGIMPHEDGPTYHPLTATVSLGGHTVLDIYEKDTNGARRQDAKWRIWQEGRSLLITKGDMYRDTLHGIAEVEEDRDLAPEAIVNWDLLGDRSGFENGIERDTENGGASDGRDQSERSRHSKRRATRISLTYRDVLKVAKVAAALRHLNKPSAGKK